MYSFYKMYENSVLSGAILDKAVAIVVNDCGVAKGSNKLIFVS